MTQVPTELRHTYWGVAAPNATELLARLAGERLGRKVPWRIFEGSKLTALLVGEGEPDDVIARDVARSAGRAYLLDFHDEAASTDQIGKDGTREKRLREHPAGFLRDHGIVAPGYEPRTSPVQSVVVVEGFPPERVRKVYAKDGMQFVPHPRGTLVTGDPGVASVRYAAKLNATVYDVLHNVEDGDFTCYVKRPKHREQCFSIGPVGNTEMYEMVDSILGESTPSGICRALDLDPELLGLREHG